MAIRHTQYDHCLSCVAVSMILAVAGCNLQPEPTDSLNTVEKLAPMALPSRQSVVAALEHAYDTRDHARFEALGRISEALYRS